MAPDALNAMISASVRPLKSRVAATFAVPLSAKGAVYGTTVPFTKAAQRVLPFASTAQIPPDGADPLIAPVNRAPPETGSNTIPVGYVKVFVNFENPRLPSERISPTIVPAEMLFPNWPVKYTVPSGVTDNPPGASNPPKFRMRCHITSPRESRFARKAPAE